MKPQPRQHRLAQIDTGIKNYPDSEKHPRQTKRAAVRYDSPFSFGQAPALLPRPIRAALFHIGVHWGQQAQSLGMAAIGLMRRNSHLPKNGRRFARRKPCFESCISIARSKPSDYFSIMISPVFRSTSLSFMIWALIVCSPNSVPPA